MKQTDALMDLITSLGYEIDYCHESAARYRAESDGWHFWMDRAKELETKMRNARYECALMAMKDANLIAD